jgi:hypothetical protein
VERFREGWPLARRFGMIYVDFQTPKLSAAWHMSAASRNAVV